MDILGFDYTTALYRRNNQGQPCVWNARKVTNEHGLIELKYGILGKTIQTTYTKTNRIEEEEIKSLVAAKRKAGYKFLSELRDNCELPVKEQLMSYVSTYLPYDRTTADDNLLPMLAKVYDNENNKLFKKGQRYLGQYKINGLRCFVRAKENQDIFKPISLEFQSREGTIWTSLTILEQKLLALLPEDLIHDMIEEGFALDGELYLPGYSVNDINHFVKDPTCLHNGLLQYWCYDIAMYDYTYSERRSYLDKHLSRYEVFYEHQNEHYKTNTTFKLLGDYDIYDDKTAVLVRDTAIDLGFEGLVMRDPTKPYQYGKRNSSMIKYKKHTDGIFTILDIYPEDKRTNIPLIKCKNDINDATFECHIGGSFEYQEMILCKADSYIGKRLLIEYSERSGVNQLPFHLKGVKLVEDDGN